MTRFLLGVFGFPIRRDRLVASVIVAVVVFHAAGQLGHLNLYGLPVF